MKSSLITSIAAVGISLSVIGTSLAADEGGKLIYKGQPVPAANFDDIPTAQEFFQSATGQIFLKGMAQNAFAFTQGVIDGQNMEQGAFNQYATDMVIDLPDAEIVENDGSVQQILKAYRAECDDLSQNNALTGEKYDYGTAVSICAANKTAKWSVFYTTQFSNYIAEKTPNRNDSDTDPKNIWKALAYGAAQGELLKCESAFNAAEGSKVSSAQARFDGTVDVAATCLQAAQAAAAISNINFYPTVGNSLANGVNCLRQNPACVMVPAHQ